MKWPRWTIATGEPHDFLPILIGCVILVMSLPAFVMILVAPDRNSGVIGTPVACILGAGIVTGLVFLVFGIRLCSFPGSLAYRVTHGRIFTR